ncbi:MAG: hypothetical protein ACP5UV_04510 [Thermoplasmata archaeon]
MNYKIVTIAVLALTVMGFASTSFASPGPAAAFDHIQSGNYSFNLMGKGNISNINYETNQIVVNGTVHGNNLTSIFKNVMMKSPESGNFNSTGNLSYASFENGEGIIMATYSSSGSASVYLNFTSRPVSSGFRFNNDMQSNYGFANYYYVNVSGQTFIVASEGQSMVNGHNITFTSSSKFMSMPGGFVFVAILNDQSIMNGFKMYNHYANGFRFNYNSKTGSVSGRYASFNFYKDNGTINSFFDNISHITVFNNITMRGNGSLPSIMMVTSPVVGNMFYYGNSTYAFAVHDNPSIQSSFTINNGSITMNVSRGITIKNETAAIRSGFTSSLNANGNVANMTMGFDQQVNAGTTFIRLNGTGFYGMIYIIGGNATIRGNEIKITTKNTSIVSFIAPPGLQRMYPGYNAFQYAMEKGRLGLQMSLEMVNSTITNYTVYLNNSINAIVKSAQNGKVVIDIDSSQHSGTVIAVFVSNGVIHNSTKMTVKFDSSLAVKTTASSLVNETSTTTAYYNITTTANGSLVLIYIPHFSTHTLEIEPYTSAISYNLYYYIAAGIVVVAIVAGLGIYFIRKKK